MVKKDINNQNKSKRPDKRCPKCGVLKSYSNFATHVKKCTETSENNELLLENLNLKNTIENQILKIKKLESENFDLKALLADKDEKLDPITINEVIYNKSYGTQLAYSTIWGRYITWCKDEGIESSSIRSALDYFKIVQDLKRNNKTLKPTTLNLISSVLQTLFKKIYSKDISKYLPKRTNFQNLKIKPKYVMTIEEIKAFLKSQINDLQNFLSCYILIFSGCRVHSLSMIKPENYQNGIFEMFDFKTQKSLEFVLSDNMKQIMDSYHKRNSNNSFLFFSQDLKMNSQVMVTTRGKYLSIKMRKLIKNSKVFEKVNFKKTSIGPHIFRTTKVHQCISKFKDLALNECRKSIGHSENSYAINFYLPKNTEVPLFTDLIGEIDYLIQNDEEWTKILNLI